MFSLWGVKKMNMPDIRGKGEVMNNRHAIHIVASIILVLLLSVSISMGDSFVPDNELKISNYPAAPEGAQKNSQEGSTVEILSIVANSFVVESDFEIQEVSTVALIDLSETMVVGLNQGDSFLSFSNIDTLANCRVDSNSGFMNFMVCTVNQGAMTIR